MTGSIICEAGSIRLLHEGNPAPVLNASPDAWATWLGQVAVTVQQPQIELLALQCSVFGVLSCNRKGTIRIKIPKGYPT